jgi:4-amino-4-deoxy-L-arabinose transferase-like glycosyltransferase
MPQKILLVLSLLTALILRLESARVRQGPDDFWRANDWEYYGIGVQLADAGKYRNFPGWPETSFRMPLYPALISLTRAASPGLSGLRFVQAILDVGALAGASLAAGVLGGAWCAAACALLGALLTVPVRQIALPQIESFYGFLIVAALGAIVLWLKKPEDRKRASLAGLAVGLSLFCRSTLAFFPPVLIAAFALTRKARIPPVSAALFLLACYLPLAPWLARNEAVFGRIIPFEEGAAALNFWGASEGLRDSPSAADLAAAGRYSDFVAGMQRLPDDVRSRAMRDRAWSNVLHRPWTYAEGAVRRFPRLWEEQWFLLLLAAGLLLARRWNAPMFATFLLAGYFNIYIFMGVQPRYARPVLYVVCVLAALGARALVRSRRPQAFPAWEGASKGLEAFVLGAIAFVAVVYLSGTGMLARGGWAAVASPDVPAEYRRDPERYRRLKEIQARGIDLAVGAQWQEADKEFSSLLEEEPCFGEALLSRAQVRYWSADRNGASSDYRRSALCLEAGRPGAPERLEQF